MPEAKAGLFRRWWVLGAVLAAVAIAAVPAAGIAHFMITNAVGRTTVATNADGTQRIVYWREPGVAGVDPHQILEGPTPEEGYETGQDMVVEIKAALTEEFQLEWAPMGDQANDSPFHRPIENQYGGQSLLTNVNGPESQAQPCRRRGPKSSEPSALSVR